MVISVPKGEQQFSSPPLSLQSRACCSLAGILARRSETNPYRLVSHGSRACRRSAELAPASVPDPAVKMRHPCRSGGRPATSSVLPLVSHGQGNNPKLCVAVRYCPIPAKSLLLHLPLRPLAKALRKNWTFLGAAVWVTSGWTRQLTRPSRRYRTLNLGRVRHSSRGVSPGFQKSIQSGFGPRSKVRANAASLRGSGCSLTAFKHKHSQPEPLSVSIGTYFAISWSKSSFVS